MRLGFRIVGWQKPKLRVLLAGFTRRSMGVSVCFCLSFVEFVSCQDVGAAIWMNAKWMVDWDADDGSHYSRAWGVGSCDRFLCMHNQENLVLSILKYGELQAHLSSGVRSWYYMLWLRWTAAFTMSHAALIGRRMITNLHGSTGEKESLKGSHVALLSEIDHVHMSKLWGRLINR